MSTTTTQRVGERPNIDLANYVRVSSRIDRATESTAETPPQTGFVEFMSDARTRAVREIVRMTPIAAVTMAIAVLMGFLSITSAVFYVLGYLVANGLAVLTVCQILAAPRECRSSPNARS